MNKEYFMKLALKEATKAAKIGEIPVGALIVKNNKIISKGYNMIEKTNDPTMHAEIIAIRRASKKINNWRLDDCEIYVTMEPCMMCCGAIIQSRIKKITYGINNINFGYTSNLKKVYITKKILEKENKQILIDFFKKIR